MNKCRDCKFYQVNLNLKAKNYGRCRRYPPIPVYDGRYDENTYSPYLHEDEWCGEWKVKETKND